MPYEIDFLAVGDGERSGDAIALRFGNLTGPPLEKWVVVIDGGFADTGPKLVDLIKTYYGTTYVDVVISTHPDGDHSGGLEAVLEQLTVGQLWVHLPWEHAENIAHMFVNDQVTDTSISEALRKGLQSARNLEKIAKKKKITIVEAFTGVYDTSGHVFVAGPTKQFYESLLPSFKCTPQPTAEYNLMALLAKGTESKINYNALPLLGTATERKADYTALYSLLLKGTAPAKQAGGTVLEDWNKETLGNDGVTTAENNTSAIIVVKAEDNGEHLLLFTGDAGIPALIGAVTQLNTWGVDRRNIKFVQIPHHGSRRNVGPDILNGLLNPILPVGSAPIRTAYVSAARDGAPKHPAKKVTNAFKRRGCGVFGTHNGTNIRFQYSAPARADYGPVSEIPMYGTVEEGED